jgi:hypothetical protein
MARDQVIFERTIAEALRRAKLLFSPSVGHASTSAPGLVPVSPGDATQFLNGDTTPAYAAVKDSDLATSDVTTNNVTSTKHGFAPKPPADATKFLNGAATPAFAQVKDSDLSTSDITTNNVSTTKHGFAPKLPNDATKFLDGTGAYSVPAGGGGGGGAVWATEDSRVAPASANALDDEFEGAAGAAIAAAWTAVNATGATAVLDGKGRVIVTSNATAGTNINACVKTAPAAPWTIYTRCSLANSASTPHSGLVVRKSSTGNLLTFGPVVSSLLTTQLQLLRWNSVTSFSSTLQSPTLPQVYWPTYYKIHNDGTTLTFSVSFIGTEPSHWIAIGTDALASFIGSVDQIGIFVDAQNASVAGVSLHEFFRVTA